LKVVCAVLQFVKLTLTDEGSA